ncbi:hypothetical protein SteCoe_7979 [Stentor coeruleus]|uniref:EF-hand domain-containing protein n=1 Tax=Stentor coeruleus TaxID=5963 RepID=A0A1R2CLA9_9CILI|nr:hypothetical protein SteCoe_7979 [Stentor coeruleus]
MSKIDCSIDENTSSKPETIVITVELDQGKKDSVFITADDSPKVLAKEFAKKHGLDQILEETLSKMIAEQQQIFEPSSKSQPKPQKKPEETSNIHKRLYMESKYTKRINKRPSLPIQQKVASPINYGEILYRQDKACQNSKWQKALAIKSNLKKESEKNLTFHPSLPHKNISTSTSASEFFLKTKPLTRPQEQPYGTKALQECSFRPKIYSQMPSTGNIHEKLYLQAVIKQSSNKKSPKILKESPKNDPDRFACVNRLLNSHLATEARIKKTKSKMETLDPTTNQELFTPIICREPTTPMETPFWDRLYTSKTPEAPEISQDIYKVFRISQYKIIFDELDEDHDGIVLSEDIIKGKFDERTLKLISRVLNGAWGNCELNLESFIDAMENGITYLSIEDRMWLLRRKKN